MKCAKVNNKCTEKKIKKRIRIILAWSLSEISQTTMWLWFPNLAPKLNYWCRGAQPADATHEATKVQSFHPFFSLFFDDIIHNLSISFWVLLCNLFPTVLPLLPFLPLLFFFLKQEFGRLDELQTPGRRSSSSMALLSRGKKVQSCTNNIPLNIWNTIYF